MGMHHTASGVLPGGDIAWLTNPAAKASAHLVIARDGTITQLAPFNIKTWHAGRSSWKGRKNCNNFMIGIEVDNPGGLTKRADGMYAGIGGPYEPEDVVEQSSPQHGSFKYWLTFPDDQLKATVGASVAIWNYYNLTDLVGHYDISPGRKTDIGPHFPMKKLEALCKGRQDVDTEAEPFDGYVRARGGLNVRRWPSVASERVDKFSDGQGLEIIRSGTFHHEGFPQIWHLAESGDVEGWVHGDFVDLV
jgi:N-acetylmuramoyl-L-alanine amidase